ncbi:RipA family octameric membrane protein [Haloferax chudinovii]|uniref:SMODS and SLOG-associating 2TM effector domain-containing protein n=1 Tax=Haloferax chudinovii TaxID=1109010 RepID=A0ABD5XL32_9EURY
MAKEDRNEGNLPTGSNNESDNSTNLDRDETLIDQYTHYAGSAMAVSDRRLSTNRFYVSLLSGILVVITFIAQGPLSRAQQVGLVTVGLLGVCLCGLWYQTVDSHRRLNQAKYEILHNMESELAYPVYKEEWDKIGPTGVSEQKRNRFPRIQMLLEVLWDITRNTDEVQYYEQTTVEKTIAALLALLYALLTVYGIGLIFNLVTG